MAKDKGPPPKKDEGDDYAKFARPSLKDDPPVPPPTSTPEQVAEMMKARAVSNAAILEAQRKGAVPEEVPPETVETPVVVKDEPIYEPKPEFVGPPRPRYKEDADPELIETLELIERIHDGRLLVAACWDGISGQLRQAIASLKAKVCV